MLLELGSGDRPYNDGRSWTHQDIRALPDIELVCPAEDISLHVEADSVDEVRATHLLEHFSYTRTDKVLREWKYVLKDGGSLYIEVPNLRWQINACASGEIDAERFVYYAYGEQDHAGNFHYAAFDEELLRKRLKGAGFRSVGITDIGQVLCAKAIK